VNRRPVIGTVSGIMLGLAGSGWSGLIGAWSLGGGAAAQQDELMAQIARATMTTRCAGRSLGSPDDSR
jgi:hypothetical protein